MSARHWAGQSIYADLCLITGPAQAAVGWRLLQVTVKVTVEVEVEAQAQAQEMCPNGVALVLIRCC